MNTVHNFSGGIDSTYSLWKWLSEHPDETLLVHHVSLRTWEKRWEKEDAAVHNVLEWLNENGLTNYEYIETVLDVCDAHPRLWDSTLTYFMLASVLTNTRFKELEYVLNNTPQDEYDRLGKTLDRMVAKKTNVFNSVRKKPLKTVYMMKGKYKKQIIKEMPIDLLELCWYCRRPQGDDVCHTCHTCKQVDKVKSAKVSKKEKKDDVQD